MLAADAKTQKIEPDPNFLWRTEFSEAVCKRDWRELFIFLRVQWPLHSACTCSFTFFTQMFFVHKEATPAWAIVLQSKKNLLKLTRINSQNDSLLFTTHSKERRLLPMSHVITQLSHTYGCFQKPVIIKVYKVLNMDFFSYKIRSLHFKRHSLTHWSCMDYFYDGWMCFLEHQKKHIAGKYYTNITGILLNITPTVFVWKKKGIQYTPTVRWLEGHSIMGWFSLLGELFF